MRSRTDEPELLADQRPTDCDSAHRLAARLAGLDLDAETLELLLAALTSDVCDHLAVDVSGGRPTTPAFDPTNRRSLAAS
jgi:hypothetical protein